MTARKKKLAIGVLAFLFAVVVILVIAVPWLVDVNRYRPEVIAHLREATGKPAEIGRLSLTLFPSLSIRVDDFTLGNPAGFPPGDFLKVSRIYAVLDKQALWNRQIVITSLQLSQPAVSLLSDVRGHWNFESPPRPKALNTASSSDQPLFSIGVISDVSVSGGHLSVANLLPSGKAGLAYFEVKGLSSQLERVDLNAFVAPASAVNTPGAALPEMARGTRWTGSVAYAAAPTGEPAAEGTLKAGLLRFDALEGTAVRSKLRLFPKQVDFDDLTLDLYGGRASGNLSLNFSGPSLRYSTSAELSAVDVARLLAAFPDARGKMTGKMEGHLKLSGEVEHSPDPLTGMRGVGELTIRNGSLPSLQLKKNLAELARLSGLGPASGDPSSFSSISADLNIANRRITSNKIVVVGNAVGVDGSGSLSLGGEGSLDYDGVAKLDAQRNAITNILAGLSGATLADGKLTFPFTLAGTLRAPKFRLKQGGGQPSEAGGLAQQVGAPAGQNPQAVDLVQGIVGLIKKKHSQQPQQPPKQ